MGYFWCIINDVWLFPFCSYKNNFNRWYTSIIYITLTNEERIVFVNSIEIEEINVTAENTAIVKISYGDIIGNDLTNERFSELVEFNTNTKYYSTGHNINSVNDLDNAKGNINSILLEKDSIKKKNPAIVISFECDDT